MWCDSDWEQAETIWAEAPRGLLSLTSWDPASLLSRYPGAGRNPFFLSLWFSQCWG